MREWLIGQREKIAGIVATSAILAPAASFASTSDSGAGIAAPDNLPPKWSTLPDIINSLFTIVISVAGVVFIILFLVGGVQYLASAGNEDAAKKAGKLMLDAVIGIVLILISWAVGTYVLGLLGLNPNALGTDNALNGTLIK